MKDIKSHGYPEKAIKQCGMRYLGPMFYGNWSPNRDLNDDGTCGNADVNYATQFKDRNVRYWYLGTDFYLNDHGRDQYHLTKKYIQKSSKRWQWNA